MGLENVGGLNFGQNMPQFDLVQQPAQAMSQVGFPGIQGYYPPAYPPMYPGMDDYSFYGPGILNSIIRVIKNCISRILTIPWRIVRFMKNAIYSLLGINDYYPSYYQYPSGPYIN